MVERPVRHCGAVQRRDEEERNICIGVPIIWSDKLEFSEVNIMEVKFYDSITDELLKFAVIISKSNDKWVFCKHKERAQLNS